MTSPRLVSLATTVPSHRLTTSDAQSFARRRFAALPGIDRLLGVFEHTGIAERWLARPIDWYEEEQDFPTRSAVWATGALRLAERAASLAIDRAGIDRSLAYDVLAASAAGAPYVEYKRKAFLDPEGTPPVFSIALAEKDLNLITAFAERLEVPVPQAHVNRDVLREAMADGRAGADFADVAVHLRGGGPG